MAEKEVGKVIHWYDKIGVAVVRISGALAVGDQVKVRKGDDEFDAAITSMQIDHKDVSSAKTGDEVAIRLPKKAKDGAAVLVVK